MNFKQMYAVWVNIRDFYIIKRPAYYYIDSEP